MKKKQKFINIIIIIIAIVALALGGYFYYQVRLLKTDPKTIAKKEAVDLVSKVSKLYLLPVGEDPTVATVSDPEVLKSQSFFTQALKDDKVLIYTRAGKAILYRPSIDKIIETAPISNNKTVAE
jgi:cell division protein YceG involved in septum cleavage